jgi:hypothetical protein
MLPPQKETIIKGKKEGQAVRGTGSKARYSSRFFMVCQEARPVLVMI